MSSSGNIATHLSQRATDTPDRVALVSPRRSLTYGQLDEMCRDYAQGMADLGIGKGTRTVVMLRPGGDFVAVCFALMRLGAIMVLVDPGMGRRHLAKCLKEAEPQAFVGIPIAHAARFLLGWASDSIRINITSGSAFPGLKSLRAMSAASQSSPPLNQTVGASDTAAIAFTSGSTGVPKGVVVSHAMFEAQCRLLGRTFDIRPGEVDLATFPLFALFDPALQMTTVFPEMDFSRPGKVHAPNIIQAIQANRVTHMFGSPALLARVAAFSQGKDLKFPTIRRVLTAGAPVSLEVISQIQDLLVQAQVHTPYGATEALPISSIGSRELFALQARGEHQGVCIGRPVSEVRTWVIPIREEPVESLHQAGTCGPGEVGELVVAGPNVSQRYESRPEANRLSKIPLDEDTVAHRMGDLVYADEEGRLWFCGRKTHRVQTAAGTLFTIPIESIFNPHRAVLRSALVGVGESPGQTPVLCVELKPKHGMARSRIRAELLELAAADSRSRGIETILFHSGFPVDVRHNSKIFREELAQWATRKMG